MFKLSNEAKFGILAILTIGLIVFGLNFMSGSKFFGPPLTLYANFEDVAGLIRGNPITMNGLKIGRVGKLDLNVNKGVATALLEFDQEFDIPENAEALIYSVDLLGSKGVKIQVPDSLTPSTVYLSDEAFIKGTIESGIFDQAEELVTTQGATILLEVAKLSVELNEIVKLTKKLLSDPNNAGSLRETLGNIKETTENLTSITSQVDSLASEITAIARDASSIVKNVENNNEDIEGIITNVRSTTDSLAVASVAVKDLMEDASSAVSSVESMVSKLDTTGGTLGLLLNDRELYDSLTNTTQHLNSVLREVQANPQRFFDDIKIYLIERKPPKEKKKKGPL